jgi:biotin carboxyl carrier protein
MSLRRFKVGTEVHVVQVDRDGACTIRGLAKNVHARVTQVGTGTFWVQLDPAEDADGAATARQHLVHLEAGDDRLWAFCDGDVYELETRPDGAVPSPQAEPAGALSPPMPATVLKILVKVGETVTKGDTLLLLGAMKMELPLLAPTDGIIDVIACSEGELVQPGSDLVTLR